MTYARAPYHYRVLAWLAAMSLLIARVAIARAPDPLPRWSRATVNFELDVLPILTAAGCNAGACHGKARGQNGFQLSLLGFDPDFDFAAITKEARGRRVFPAAPDNSLLLRKATLALPHGGGQRLTTRQPAVRHVRRWIAAGMPRDHGRRPDWSGSRVEPAEHVWPPASQRAIARHGPLLRRLDARRHAPERLSVERSRAWSRSIATGGQGRPAAAARRRSWPATWTSSPPGTRSSRCRRGRRAAVRRAAAQELHRRPRLGQAPAAGHHCPASRPPTPRSCAAPFSTSSAAADADEARAFLASTAPAKRESWSTRCLDRPEYADYWANKWADLLRPIRIASASRPCWSSTPGFATPSAATCRTTSSSASWSTAQGSTLRNGAATLFRDRREPDEITPDRQPALPGHPAGMRQVPSSSVRSLGPGRFLQLRGLLRPRDAQGEGISPPISGGEEIVFTADSGAVAHPLTGKVLEPRPLFGTARAIAPGEDPREALADWMTSPDNPYFAQVMVNRVWADLMGRGLVDPVDDLRATNPPSNRRCSRRWPTTSASRATT